MCIERANATSVASFVNVYFLYGFPVPVDRTPEAICSQVARLLKEERQKQGLSLNLLAEKAGLARQTVTFVEQELRTPTLDTLLRLTSGLGVDLEKIIARARKVVSSKTK
jgi:predicted transcriptional regulator